MSTFTHTSLPVNDNVNPYAFAVDVTDQFFVQRGAMIAYFGQLRFERLSHVDHLRAVVTGAFHSPLHAGNFMVASGSGRLIVAHQGFHVDSYELEDGNLTVRAGQLLGFAPTLRLKESIIPGFVTLLGTGRFLAASHGGVHFLEPPMRVDPEALVGWADCPSPCHHYDTAYMQRAMGAVTAQMGVTSAEEHQFEFSGAGTILLQSAEPAPPGV